MMRLPVFLTTLLTLVMPPNAPAQEASPGLRLLPNAEITIQPREDLAPGPEVVRDLRLTGRQIAQFLRAHPALDREAKPLAGGRLVLPPELTNGARHGFEKRMAISGHGQVFDIEGRPVEITRDAAIKLLSEIFEVTLAEARGSKPTKIQNPERLLGITKQLDALRRARDLDADSRLYLQYLSVRAEAQWLDDERRSALIWRVESLSRVIFPKREVLEIIDARIVDVRFELADWFATLFAQTAYMRSCAAQDVPVPPDFATNSPDWSFQGNLSNPLIVQGKVAAVYTYASPSVRGSCIALPRGPGGVTDVAGIICQSAETGKACFWDNLEKGTSDILPFGNTATLKISEMQDGSELALNCTGCHQGNNVFNISPDDTTWCRVLRGGQPGSGCASLSGANAANFTTEVDPGVLPLSVPGINPPVLHSRYTPLSGVPPRVNWVNNTGPGCGGACHLGPNGAFNPPAMPPSCGANCN